MTGAMTGAMGGAMTKISGARHITASRPAGVSTGFLNPASRLWRGQMGGKYGPRSGIAWAKTFNTNTREELMVTCLMPLGLPGKKVYLTQSGPGLEGPGNIKTIEMELTRKSPPEKLRAGLKIVDEAVRTAFWGPGKSLILDGDRESLFYARELLGIWLGRALRTEPGRKGGRLRLLRQRKLLEGFAKFRPMESLYISFAGKQNDWAFVLLNLRGLGKLVELLEISQTSSGALETKPLTLESGSPAEDIRAGIKIIDETFREMAFPQQRPVVTGDRDILSYIRMLLSFWLERAQPGGANEITKPKLK